MKCFLFILLIIFGINASAQEPTAAGCNPEALKKIQGVWLAPTSDGMLNKPATDIAAAKKILDAIRQRFQEQYTPIGVDARHSYFFENDMGFYQRYGNPYNYALQDFRFFCLHGKKTTGEESDSGLKVFFNNEGTAEVPIYLDYGDFGINSEINTNGGFHTLNIFHCPDGKLPDVSAGYHKFGDENNYYVWFTHDGKLPYRYVTRKEFLEKQVAIIEAQIKEFEKKLLSPEMKAVMEANPAYKEQMMEGFKMYRNPMESYQNDLKKDAAWLNEIAIAHMGMFENVVRYVFTTLVDNPQNSQLFIPIMPNPDYYDRKLPKWAPQYFSIYIRGNTKHENVTNLRKLSEENIEFFKSIVANRGLPK